MGDSYTAGPGLPPLDQQSGACLRSTANYPAVVAEKFDADLSDVSCSGADSKQISTDANRYPAQIDAVTADTDLVTLTLGANDGGLFTQMISACAVGDQNAATCERFATDQLPGLLDQTEQGVRSSLELITKKAPDATVVLVGYLPLTREGACAEMNLSERLMPLAQQAQDGIEDAQRRAAKDTGVEFVSMMDIGAGHDPCGKEPWTNGLVREPADGILAHPNKTGMRATADAVTAALEPLLAE